MLSEIGVLKSSQEVLTAQVRKAGTFPWEVWVGGGGKIN